MTVLNYRQHKYTHCKTKQCLYQLSVKLNTNTHTYTYSFSTRDKPKKMLLWLWNWIVGKIHFTYKSFSHLCATVYTAEMPATPWVYLPGYLSIMCDLFVLCNKQTKKQQICISCLTRVLKNTCLTYLHSTHLFDLRWRVGYV